MRNVSKRIVLKNKWIKGFIVAMAAFVVLSFVKMNALAIPSYTVDYNADKATISNYNSYPIFSPASDGKVYFKVVPDSGYEISYLYAYKVSSGEAVTIYHLGGSDHYFTMPDDYVTVVVEVIPLQGPGPEKQSNTYWLSLMDNINVAIKNDYKGVIEWNAGDGLPKEVVETLIANPDITVHFTYSYEGVDYDLMLNGKKLATIYKEDVEWYGPLNLARCNGYAVGNGYVVKEGDTLSAIAVSMGTTIETILARNPEITNKDLIYADQIIY